MDLHGLTVVDNMLQVCRWNRLTVAYIGDTSVNAMDDAVGQCSMSPSLAL